MPTTDDIKADWDKTLKSVSEELIECMEQHKVSNDRLDRASLANRDTVLGYWKFKRILVYAAEIEERWKTL